MDDTSLARRIGELYGEVDWAGAAGLLHVAAVSGAPPRAIAIGPEAPASAIDRFVLGFARARADVILTSGSILRAEPELVHCYAEQAAEQTAFERWRRRVLGREHSPACLVVSSSGRFPVDHPALLAAHSGCVWTSAAGRARLAGALPARFSIAGANAPDASLAASVAAAVEHARTALGARTILVEAGPTIAATLYPRLHPEQGDSGGDPGGAVDEPQAMPATRGVATACVDELLLSRFEGELAAAAIGPDFVPEDRIRARLGDPRSVARRLEPSGPWRFERYRIEG